MFAFAPLIGNQADKDKTWPSALYFPNFVEECAAKAGVGDLTLKFGTFAMRGIGTATFGAIILYQILAWSNAKE